MLQIIDIYKSFGPKSALAGVSFAVQPGETIAILGPSGCGKSTLLSIIAGLETPDRGELNWAGVSLAGIPPHRRGFGLMFQDFALFPHKNVFENVAFGLRLQGLTTEQIKPRVQQTLELVGLPGFDQRDVNTLSGGEQQRVALARALTPHPRLLLLDEPLGSLDRSLRERLALDLREILQHSRQTSIYVTHDQEEAFTLGERLVVMKDGQVEQIGAPEQIYCQPASRFVARFLGLTNLLPATILSSRHGEILINTPIGRFSLPFQGDGFKVGDEITVLLRPDAIELGETSDHRLQGSLAETVFRGSVTRATVDVPGLSLVFDFPSRSILPAIGRPITLSFDPNQALQVFKY
jgi:ABC-type Fe3+/spermidine/putrescine transport system ATPase subunit